MPPSATLISLLAGVSIAYLIYRQFRLRRRGALPPGPQGYPIIGNFWDIAKDRDLSWVRYWKWSQIYGDIIHHEVLGQHTIVLNSQKVLVDLLDNRSNNYSDRPDMPMVMGLMRTDCLFGFFRYSDWWRAHRKTFYQGFQPRVLPEYYDIQRTAAALLMDKLTTTPENFVDHIQYYSGSVILKIVYGYSMQETVNDPYLRLVLNAGEGVIAAANHGSFWVDYFPFLKYVPSWVPGAGFKAKAKTWKQYNKDLRDEPYSWVKRALEDGTAIPSFCTKSVETLSVTPGDGSRNESMIKNCAANAYVGGADTIFSSVATFILAMSLYPEFQVLAQKEIDSVVGNERAPDFNDRDKLPFVAAVLKETARWNPVVPSTPHRATNDDVYEGYYIPAGKPSYRAKMSLVAHKFVLSSGATVVANSWSVLHDENLYGPNPMEFNPMRFVKPGENGTFPPDPACFAFGYGRRICPGKDFGQNATYLAVTSLLSRFTIAKALDKDGNEIVPKVEYNDGLISYPKPFQCRFIPRNTAVQH